MLAPPASIHRYTAGLKAAGPTTDQHAAPVRSLASRLFEIRMNPPPPPLQLCFRCGLDVSSARRFKDAAGKLYCASCAQALQRRRAAAARVASGSVPASPTTLPPASPPTSSDTGEYQLEQVEEALTRAPCPACGSSFEPNKAACPSCGYDPATVPLNPDKAREVLGEAFDAHPDDTAEAREQRRQRKLKRDAEEARLQVPLCSECSYELTGVPSDNHGGIRCPECGTINRIRVRLAHDELVSREMAREMFRKPIVYLAIGGGLYVAFYVFQAVRAAQAGVTPGGAALGLTSTGPDYVKAASVLAGGAILFAFAWLVGLITLLVVGKFLFDGIDSHPRHTALFVAAAISCSLSFLVVGAALTSGMIFLLPLGITTFMYAAMLADMNDIELRDARIVSMVTWVIIALVAAVVSLI